MSRGNSPGIMPWAGIILDGRGTPGRGKAFHLFSWKKIHECAGLRDHVGSLGQLKEKYPFLDLERVGIWGNSGGGYATVSAMFHYPDVYKARRGVRGKLRPEDV